MSIDCLGGPSLRSAVTVVMGVVLAFAAPLRAVTPDLAPWRDKPSTTASAASLPPKQGALACEATARELALHGHRDAAIGMFERARQLDDKRTNVARELAVLYDQAGWDAKALIEYQRAIRETSRDPDLLNDLGYFYLSRGDAAQAEKWFRAVLNKVPGHARAIGNLAMAVAEQGRDDEAYELFVRVTTPAAAHSNLGVVKTRRGDFEGAIHAFRQALELDARIQPAKATLDYLVQHSAEGEER